MSDQRARGLASAACPTLPTSADIDAVVTLIAETRMDGVGYSLSRLEPPFCVTGVSGPVTLCYLVRSGTAWLEVDGAQEPVRELPPGTIVGESGLFEHWIKSAPDMPTHHARPLTLEPLARAALKPRRSSGTVDSVEIVVGHAPLESLSLMVGSPGVNVIAPDDNPRVSRRVWAAVRQIEEELTDPDPLGGRDAAVRRLSELILLNIARHFVASSARDELDVLGTQQDVRILRAIAAAAEGPLAQWTAGRLAGIAGMSRTVFCERFRALTGQSPLQTITRTPLRQAASDLAHGREPVGVIADGAGYASAAAFTRAFTRCFGVTPKRWRALRAP